MTIEEVGKFLDGELSYYPIHHYRRSYSNLGIIHLVPVNLKNEDAFHLTLEEYLLALISLVDELVSIPSTTNQPTYVFHPHPTNILPTIQSRLAVNSVTLGDYKRPLLISNFVKDLHAEFQLLNLKNDILRKRSDAIKYSVRSSTSVSPFLSCLHSLKLPYFRFIGDVYDSRFLTGQESRRRSVRSIVEEPHSEAWTGGMRKRELDHQPFVCLCCLT